MSNSLTRREAAVRSQTPTERPANNNSLPERYLFGNPISSVNNSKLRSHNNTSHYHSSSNIR
jgi:hypothetical protein